MNRPTPPVPWSPPLWLTPDRIVLAAVVAFAAAAALPAVQGIPTARYKIEVQPGAVAVVALSTALLSLILVRFALRATTARVASLRCVWGGALAGALNAGLSLAGMGVIRHGDMGSALWELVGGSLFGSIFGGPLGFVFGASYAVVVVSAVRARLDPSHDGPDRVLTTVGVWLFLGGACAELARQGVPVAVSPSRLAVLGLGLAALGAARRYARRAWLARVAAGVEPAWQLDVLRGEEQGAGLLPLIRPDGRLQDGVLLYRAPGHDRYRSVAPSTPAALTTLPEARSTG
ncbi:hypothetical protein WME95_22400 [Sorangium sp. So ce327]|uniref:hypothetical protein n=1 Tax=Sorangium sp. So ce327 TaxID=3133301 RepID=UPI003F63D964